MWVVSLLGTVAPLGSPVHSSALVGSPVHPPALVGTSVHPSARRASLLGEAVPAPVALHWASAARTLSHVARIGAAPRASRSARAAPRQRLPDLFDPGELHGGILARDVPPLPRGMRVARRTGRLPTGLRGARPGGWERPRRLRRRNRRLRRPRQWRRSLFPCLRRGRRSFGRPFGSGLRGRCLGRRRRPGSGSALWRTVSLARGRLLRCGGGRFWRGGRLAAARGSWSPCGGRRGLPDRAGEILLRHGGPPCDPELPRHFQQILFRFRRQIIGSHRELLLPQCFGKLGGARRRPLKRAQAHIRLLC